MNKQYTQKEIDGLVEMSNADSRFELYDIGVKSAATQVDETHFPDSFKLVVWPETVEYGNKYRRRS